MKKRDLKLFGTAFFQVFCISANTYFISKLFWVGIAMAGFTISYLWTVNVKKIACANLIDRLIYSTGAILGGISGICLSNVLIISILKHL